MADLIERDKAIDTLQMDISIIPYVKAREYANAVIETIYNRLKQLSPAQPEITDEQAISHLQDTGWMQNHNHEMYMMGRRDALGDDSGSYDSLIPAERKVGKWIIDGHHIKCSSCGVSMCNTDREGDKIPREFCPACGAKMEE